MARGYQIYILKDGEQIGPFTKGRLEEMLGEGEVNQDALVWHDKIEEWGCISVVFPDVISRLAQKKQSEEYWANLEPATKKQVKFLRSLGVKFDPDISKFDAIDLIDKALNAATDPQKRRLNFYGIAISDDLTKDAASLLIDRYKREHPESEDKYQKWKASLPEESLEPSIDGEFRLNPSDLREALDDAKENLKHTQEDEDSSTEDVSDARDELKEAHSARVNFWRATIHPEGIDGCEDPGMLYGYEHAAESLNESYGRFFKVPSKKIISETLAALDKASDDWDETEPHAFFATLKASFPELLRKSVPARSIQQNYESDQKPESAIVILGKVVLAVILVGMLLYIVGAVLKAL